MTASALSTHPTRVRYAMVLLAMFVAILLYLDRICLSTASAAVKMDLGLDGPQLDQALAAFFWTYALFQLPAGWLGDRFGARYVLAAYVALWSLSTGLLGLVNSITGLIMLRLCCGAFEAGAYPLAAGIVGRWIPQHQRGIANSVVAVGGRFGGALAPIITIQLMLLWSFGWQWESTAEPAPTSWRPVVILYGLIGLAVAVIFAKLFRDYPREHPRVNAAELAIIGGQSSRPAGATILADATPTELVRFQPKDVPRPATAVLDASVRQTKSELPPIGAMCTNLSLWLNSFLQFASNFGWAFLVTSMPQYLRQVHHTTAQSQGWLQSLPLACGVVGMLLGGLLLDFLTRRWGVRIGRVLMLSLPRLLVGLAFFGCSGVTNPIQATIFLAIMGLATDLSISAMWAFAQDIGGRHVGSVLGWANMWGNLGAACSPLAFGFLVRLYPDNVPLGWKTAFMVCGAIQLVAAVAALRINASQPLQVNTRGEFPTHA